MRWRPDEVRPRFGSYHALDLGPTGGGIVECATSRPLWLPDAEVERMAEQTERAKKGGRARSAARGAERVGGASTASPAAGERRRCGRRKH